MCRVERNTTRRDGGGRNGHMVGFAFSNEALVGDNEFDNTFQTGCHSYQGSFDGTTSLSEAIVAAVVDDWGSKTQMCLSTGTARS